eukprot:CAMPEP_0194158706 /NCGR_PEP_ID=MMETSP0152-20130528/77276_1 /TAXON_ID=1049557 /ORGANISM="Thalassiothrix antarctica, Strain L6-D1" /LENGTH=353 /DNA_ID=CAMNT_0038868165 /DNA_START=53 /DNA_END=1114 /DNA_ORIENTATION=+
MYGGLFGDLPSAKKPETILEKDAKSKSTQAPAVIVDAASTSTIEIKKKQSSLILSGLGNVGTSMAFVPTALRPRKRQKAAPPNVKVKIVQGKVINRRTANIAVTQGTQVVSKQKIKLDLVTKQEKKKVIENIHATGNEAEKAVFLVQEEEDTEFQQLHVNITDPYDPYVPNDLLAHWERKKIEEERLKLEQEARETLKRQQHLRQQLEEERQKIEKSGSANAIIEHRARTALSGGRSRGVNNLPAWLLQKQKEELRTTKDPQSSTEQQQTVVLSNLTAPNEIDDDLADEVREECEEKCGLVKSVRVKNASPPNQPEVEVFVKFLSSQDADKAEKLFHGRMFGNRRITAKRINN